MSDFFGEYPYIRKPRKPIAVDRQKLTFRILQSENADKINAFNKKANYLMEMMKFFPEYESKLYQGSDQDEILEAMNEYGQVEETEDGLLEPSFGQVKRALSNSSFRGVNQGRDVEGLQFEERAGDFEHLALEEQGEDGEITRILRNRDFYNPVIKDLAGEDLWLDELWENVVNSLENEERNYYQMMMDGIEDFTPEKAFNLMAAMLESRTRVWNTMTEIFGTEDMTDQERMAVFDNWLAENEGEVDAGKIGFLRLFLDISQSFVSRLLPMFGGSLDNYISEMDQEKVTTFFNALANKVEQYIGVANFSEMSEEELAELPRETYLKILLWNSWLNPSNFPGVEASLDPEESEWGQYVLNKLDKLTGRLVGRNIGANVVSRGRRLKYKTEYEEYEEKIEEERQIEKDEKKAEAKRKQEKDRLEKISSEKNKAQEKELNKVSNQQKVKLRQLNMSVDKRLNISRKNIQDLLKKLDQLKTSNQGIAKKFAKKIQEQSKLGQQVMTQSVKNIKESNKRINKAVQRSQKSMKDLETKAASKITSRNKALEKTIAKRFKESQQNRRKQSNA